MSLPACRPIFLLIGLGLALEAPGQVGRSSIAGPGLGLFEPVGAAWTDEAYDSYILGKSFFKQVWVEAPAATRARDGLGPLYNARSCHACHPQNGPGPVLVSGQQPSPALILKLSRDGTTDTNLQQQTMGRLFDPVYGGQINTRGIHGVAYEALPRVTFSQKKIPYRDGMAVVLKQPTFFLESLNYGPLADGIHLHARRAPALIGLGTIEDIPVGSILAHADPEDRDGDGVSGRANWVWEPAAKGAMLGRFGWKAEAATVKQQTALALSNDMGLTSPLYPEENCSARQQTCLQAPRGEGFDVPMPRLEAIVYYLKHLQTPDARRSTEHRRGAELFDQLGCAACHVTKFTTQKGVVIAPMSDFLLHDMGEGLADQGRAFAANGREWRTAPLWGLSLFADRGGFLHDGRAETLEQAILWHGGEAQGARKRFQALPLADRWHLIQYLRSL